MRPIAKTALAAPVLAYGWLAAASAIYCAGTGKLVLFRFPFVQWAEAAPWWRLNGTMTLWVSVAAVIPSLLLLVCGAGLVRVRKARTEVYGKTSWASRQQMKAGGNSASQRPF
jgi:hypothetical protein